MVMGYVGVCSMIRAEKYVSRDQAYRQPDFDQFLFLPDVTTPDRTYNYYYDLGNVPIKQDGDNWLWGPRRCVDCRQDGGSKTKPEGWPTGH